MAKVKIGSIQDLYQALLIEFLRHQKTSKLHPCIAIETKQKGILLEPDEWWRKEIEVERIILVVLHKLDGNKLEILAQYPLSLKYSHKIPDLRYLRNKVHYQWDLIPVSEPKSMEKDKK